MYVIIVGAGNIGQPLIEIATSEHHDVVVIENRQPRAADAADMFDCLVLHADATLKETLIEAGAREADAIIATTDHDATNIMICLLAKELEIPHLVSVVHRPEDIGVFRQIGVHAMENPQRLIAEYLFRAVKYPSIRDYMRVGDGAEIMQLEVPVDASIVGLTLREAAEEGILPDDVLVVAVDRPDATESMIPRGDTVVHAGDTVVVYSATGSGDHMTAAFKSSSD